MAFSSPEIFFLLQDTPPELLIQILSKLELRQFYNFRMTTKWLNQFIAKHRKRIKVKIRMTDAFTDWERKTYTDGTEPYWINQ